MRRADTISAVGFLLFAAAMLALALLRLPEIEQTLAQSWAEEDAEDAALLDKAAYVAGAGESALAGQLDPAHLYIQLYGGVQRLLGRRYVADVVPANSVVKLTTGALTFLDKDAETPDAAANARATAALSRWLADRSIPFLAVAAPQKAVQAALPAGLTEPFNACADQYLSELEAEGVDALDLRPAFDARADRDALFFRTDHHWTPQGAFFAYQLLSNELAVRFGFQDDLTLTDPANYTWETVPGLFLGSQGKRVGSLYAGTDDFPVVTPKFDTDFTYTTPYGTRSGPFEQSLCFPEFIAERDWFGGNPYVYYSGGDYGEAVMENHLNPDGPKVLLIRESFSCALAPFLAQSCSSLTTVDMRYLERPLAEVVEETQPDLVLLLCCASSFRLSELFSWELPASSGS